MTASLHDVVSLRDVVVEYATGSTIVRAVDGVSLSVQPGASLAVVGRSGSGKSSLVAAMGLMREPSSGSVWLGGEEVPSGSRERARLRAQNIGMVFQSFHLEPHLTARENCLMSWYWGAADVGRRRAVEQAEEVLGLVGLRSLAGRKVAAMSGGERQRVAIARALFSRPALLIADEPTGNLDEENSERVAQILFGLPREADCAVVVVTHDPSVARGADDIVKLSRGRVTLHGVDQPSDEVSS